MASVIMGKNELGHVTLNVLLAARESISFFGQSAKMI